MDILATTSTLSPANQYFYDRNLLSMAQHLLCHERFAQMRPIDTKSGDYIKFHRYVIPTASTTALTEGVNPAATSVVRESVTSLLKEYGAFTTFSSKVDLVNQDKVLVDLGRVMGKHGALSMDTVARDVFLGGTSVYYANAVAGMSSIVTGISNDDLDNIDRSLLDNRADYISQIVPPGSGYGSSSVSRAWFCIAHTDCKKDIKNLTGFIPVKDYANQNDIQEGEEGAVGEFRFILSTNAKKYVDSGGDATTNSLKYTTADSACDVYPILIFGQDAVGACPLKGNAMRNIINQVGSAGAADALHRYGTTGWAATSTYVILNESWMYRYLVGVSA